MVYMFLKSCLVCRRCRTWRTRLNPPPLPFFSLLIFFLSPRRNQNADVVGMYYVRGSNNKSKEVIYLDLQEGGMKIKYKKVGRK